MIDDSKEKLCMVKPKGRCDTTSWTTTWWNINISAPTLLENYYCLDIDIKVFIQTLLLAHYNFVLIYESFRST